MVEDKDFFSPRQVTIKFIPGAGGSDTINKIIAGEADIAFADPGALFPA